MCLSVRTVEDDVAANEIAPERWSAAFHHDEAAAGRRVDDHVAGQGGGTDQSGNQNDRLGPINAHSVSAETGEVARSGLLISWKFARNILM
jgi:hypothetical protein